MRILLLGGPRFLGFALDETLRVGTLQNESIEFITGDVLAWAKTRSTDYVFRAGLGIDRETELLRRWDERGHG